MFLVDDEVGDGGLDLEGRSGGDGAAADVDLHAHVIHLGHVAVLLGLGDAAGVAQVGLDDVQGAVLDELAEAPAGVAALAGGQRQVAAALDVLKQVGVGGAGGLLIVHNVVGLQSLAQLGSRVGVQQGVYLHDDVQIVASGLPGSCDTVHSQLQVMLAVTATVMLALGLGDSGEVGLFARDHGGGDLDGVIAVGDGILRNVIVLLRIAQEVHGVVPLDGGPPTELQLGSVGTQLLVRLAADELVDRQVQGLAIDVPTGSFAASHGPHSERHPAPTKTSICSPDIVIVFFGPFMLTSPSNF